MNWLDVLKFIKFARNLKNQLNNFNFIKMKKSISVLVLSFLMAWSVSAQEFNMPLASPLVKVEQNFSTSYINLEYSRPAVKDRKVFGEMIPFGDVWRTGANATSKVSFGEELIIAGQAVKPGTYSLYTIPGEKEWTVMLNTDLDNWGADGYDESKNVMKANIPVVKLRENQESFLLNVEDITTTSANLVLAWADTKIEIPIRADNHDRIMEYFAKELKGKNPPYMRAASYYLANNVKLDEAAKYMEMAIKESPEAYYMYWTQAQILEKLGKKDDALKSAKVAAEMAKKTSPAFAHEYERNYKEMSKRMKK